MCGCAGSDIGTSAVAIGKSGTFKIPGRPGSVDVKSTDATLA